MGLKKEHVELLRVATMDLLGGVCIACGDYDRSTLHVHHIIPCKDGEGRGRDLRAWEGLHIAVCHKALLLCPYCHGMLHSKDVMLWMQSSPTMSTQEAFRRDLMEDYKGEGYWDVVC